MARPLLLLFIGCFVVLVLDAKIDAASASGARIGGRRARLQTENAEKDIQLKEATDESKEDDNTQESSSSMETEPKPESGSRSPRRRGWPTKSRRVTLPTDQGSSSEQSGREGKRSRSSLQTQSRSPSPRRAPQDVQLKEDTIESEEEDDNIQESSSSSEVEPKPESASRSPRRRGWPTNPRRATLPTEQGSSDEQSSCKGKRSRSSSPTRRRTPSPRRPPQDNKLPESWVAKPLDIVETTWWLKPDNGFDKVTPTRSSLLKTDVDDITEGMSNLDLHEKKAQLVAVNDRDVQRMRDSGAGNELPKDMERACKLDVDALSAQNVGVLLVGDKNRTILQPLRYPDTPEGENILPIAHGEVLAMFCAADENQLMEFECRDQTLYDKQLNKPVKLEDLKCADKFDADLFVHEKPCNELDPDSVFIYIGYSIEGIIYKVVTVCWEPKSGQPYWSKHEINGKNSAARCTLRDGDFTAPPLGIYASKNVPALYKNLQNRKQAFEKVFATTKVLDLFVGTDRGHLIPFKDLPYGKLQSATNHYINQTPQPQGPNRGNWKDIESEERKTVEASGKTAIIETGTFEYIRKNSINVTLSPAEEKKYKLIPDDAILYLDHINMQIPYNNMYFKTVFIKELNAGIAFLCSNIPIPNEVPKLCEDVCDQYGWMQTMARANYEKGFAYCCTLESFYKALPYLPGKKLISNTPVNVLKYKMGE